MGGRAAESRWASIRALSCDTAPNLGMNLAPVEIEQRAGKAGPICTSKRCIASPKPLRRKAAWEPVSYSHPVFRPYVAALGQIALTWNGLHSQLALLFCTVMLGAAILTNSWRSGMRSKATALQRDVLEACSEGVARDSGSRIGAWEDSPGGSALDKRSRGCNRRCPQ